MHHAPRAALCALVFPLTALAIGSLGCAPIDPPETEGPETTEAPSPIVNGQVDTTNKATVLVMGLSSNGEIRGQCTGTIIHRAGTTGYVLTAGHCNSSGQFAVIIADDWYDCFTSSGRLDATRPGCEGVFVTDDKQRHPRYRERADGLVDYDFLIARFPDALPNIPIVPAVGSSDGLAPDSPLEISGYGLMNSGNNLVDTSERRHAFTIVDSLYDSPSPLIAYRQGWTGPYGGPCSGDSGGPAYVGEGADKRVVGVTSVGDQNCQQFGASARVSAIYDDFIAPYLGVAPGATGCTDCVNANVLTCKAESDACAASEACVALSNCVETCTDARCVTDCESESAEGKEAFEAMASCRVCDRCADACSEEGFYEPLCVEPDPQLPPLSGSSGSGSSSNSGSDDDSGCSVVAPRGARGAVGAGALMLLGLAFGARRRRSRR